MNIQNLTQCCNINARGIMYKICWKQNTLKKIQGIVSFFHVKFLRIISEYLRILNDIRSWYLTQLTDIDMKTSIQSFVYESQTIIIGKETFILRKFEAFASDFRECLEEIFPRDACSKYNLQSHMLPVAKGLTQQKVNAVTKTLHGTSIFFMWMNYEFQGKLVHICWPLIYASVLIFYWVDMHLRNLDVNLSLWERATHYWRLKILTC